MEMETTLLHSSQLLTAADKSCEASLENLNSVFNEIYAGCHNDEPRMAAIDTMIVQVVDMVKSHLLYAVREEFEVLKAKIFSLEVKVNDLEHENKILREFAPSDVVGKLDDYSASIAADIRR